MDRPIPTIKLLRPRRLRRAEIPEAAQAQERRLVAAEIQLAAEAPPVELEQPPAELEQRREELRPVEEERPAVELRQAPTPLLYSEPAVEARLLRIRRI